MDEDEVKAVMKKEKDGNHPSSHYLVVEDAKMPSTWHLRIKGPDGQPDHRLMGAAWAALHQGYRGNQYQGPNKDAAISKLTRLYKSEGMQVPGKMFDDWDEMRVSYGQTVKALEGGKVGGYLVTFGGLDVTGDYFDNQTDFGEYSRLPVLYHHGFDDTIKTRRIGTANIKQDEIGLWAEAQLQLRDEYEKAIYELAQKGKLGWSSGAASHVTSKTADDFGNHITQWYMAEASLTPCPAEPRNEVIPLKMYLGDNESATKSTEGEPEALKSAVSEGDGAEPTNQPESQGDLTMENIEELQALIDGAVEKAATKAAEDAVKAFRESEPPELKAQVSVTKDEADQPFESAGAFFQAVKTAGTYPAMTDKKLLGLKATGANETIPSQGGFLVPPQYAAGILETMWQEGTLLSRFNPIAVSGNSMTFNIVDETSRANGSRYGGVQAYWAGEGTALTASQPKFRQLELKLKKVIGLVYATDELLADASAMEGWINNTVPKELRFKVENAIINGSGVGEPLGILNSPALTTKTRIDATQIDPTDIGNLWAGRLTGFSDYFWCGNVSIFPQLLNLSIGNVPVYLPSGGLGGLPYATLLGRPYFDTEYNPTLGEIGDLLLVTPSAYPMIQKGGVQAASSIHVNFTSDEQVFRFVYRIDGAPSYNSTVTGYDSNTYAPFVALTTST